jgi:hypothetical protein
MAKATFKKTARTTFCGQCKVGGTWVERVRTSRQANKAERRACKVALTAYKYTEGGESLLFYLRCAMGRRAPHFVK